MKHKLYKLTAALLLALLLVSAASAAGGDGTAENPYIIQTPAELQSMQNDLSAYYILANDIDMSGFDFVPIGSSDNPATTAFHGSLDGNGYTISNLNIDLPSTQYVGLFAVITAGTSIKNLNFEDCTISGASYTAVLIGRCIGISGVSSQVTIDNIDMYDCTVTSSGESVGNVAGSLASGASNVQIKYCTVGNCTVTSSGESVGNVVGSLASGASAIGMITQCEVISCHAKSSTYRVGNVAGRVAFSYGNGTIQETVVKNCVAESPSSADVGNVAGYVANGASAIGWVKNCHVENCISIAYSNVGNVVGYITYGSSAIGIISDCTVENCTVKARGARAGGIAGCGYASSFASIEKCAVSNTTILALSSDAGGICSTFKR